MKLSCVIKVESSKTTERVFFSKLLSINIWDLGWDPIIRSGIWDRSVCQQPDEVYLLSSLRPFINFADVRNVFCKIKKILFFELFREDFEGALHLNQSLNI